MRADTKQQLAERVAEYQRNHPTGGNPPYEIVSDSRKRIWLCEIETNHQQVEGTNFCRCMHAMYC